MKIAAIKLLRSETGCSLRDGKGSIERLMHEIGVHQFPHAAKTAKAVTTAPRVKKVIVDLGDGDIEVDLEGLQLIALMRLQSIGLSACSDILDLVGVLKAFSDGKRIGVLADDNVDKGTG